MFSSRKITSKRRKCETSYNSASILYAELHLVKKIRNCADLADLLKGTYLLRKDFLKDCAKNMLFLVATRCLWVSQRTVTQIYPLSLINNWGNYSRISFLLTKTPDLYFSGGHFSSCHYKLCSLGCDSKNPNKCSPFLRNCLFLLSWHSL